MAKKLAKRELEILALIADGLNSKEIANVLQNSPRTIENMRARMILKLGARNVAHMVAIAYQKGILKLNK